MTPRKPGVLWLFNVDERHGELWHGTFAAGGHGHMERVDSIDNTWEAHEHHRPSPLSARHDGYIHAAPHHEAEALRHHWGKDIAGWLEAQLDRREIEHVHVFAPPRLLGELRRCFGDSIGAKIAEHQGDLMHLEAADLARHPAVAPLLGARG